MTEGEVSVSIAGAHHADLFHGISEIITAMSGWLWPALAIYVIVSHKKDIQALAKRVERGKIFGAEFELKKELDSLQAQATQAEAESTPAPSVAPEVYRDEGAVKTAKVIDERGDRFIETVLAEASRSPKLGLMLLASGIDRLARQVGAATGHPSSSLSQTVSTWTGQLPPQTAETLKLFTGIRNRIVHGAGATDEEAIRAIDSGIALYRAINAIPRETNIVYHPGVPIFSDRNCTMMILDARGVILEASHPQTETTRRIFPTSRDDYVRGMQVTWEWNMGRVWGEAWYRDPDNQEIRAAWSSSAEFVGRDINAV